MFPVAKHCINRGPSIIARGPNMGDAEEKLSRAVEKITGNYLHCLLTSSGSAANLMAQIHYEEFKIAIVPSLTFISTINAPMIMGKQTYLVPPDGITGLVKHWNNLAVYPKNDTTVKVDVPLYGNGPSKDTNFHICDGAQAFGHPNFGKYAVITATSFHPSKIITGGECGAVFTAFTPTYLSLRRIRDSGRDTATTSRLIVPSSNFFPHSSACDLIIKQIPMLEKFIAKRRLIRKWYEDYLGELKSALVPADEGSTCSMVVIRVRISRNRLQHYLNKAGIMTSVNFPRYRTSANYFVGDYSFHKKCLSLPSYYKLTKSDVSFICNKLIEGLSECIFLDVV